MIQVFASSKECWPGDMLPETLVGQSLARVWPEYHFLTFGQVFKSIMRTDKSVSESVSRLRVDV